MAALLIGLAVGYFAAQYRSRRDIRVLERNIDVHLTLARAQLQMQVDSAAEAQKNARRAEAYDQLGRWLHDLERTIDEVWSGCCMDDASVRDQARATLDRWPWETLRVPYEFASAQFYWSEMTRERLREFSGISSKFVNSAMIAIGADMSGEEEQRRLGEWKSRVWESRSDLLAAIDRVRDRVGVELEGVTRR
ncbi:MULTISPECIES: hypothetical protein [Amycolatopsis]|uniref:hypothetical protein n=1 Tax=Amycolatopsis TaxID=1813 RepID=UPI00106E8CE1|nr:MULTISPECIES: hypothetical protein [Amycolatopsis]